MVVREGKKTRKIGHLECLRFVRGAVDTLNV